MKYHKCAQLFPLMQGEEFDALVLDIAENGLIEPIVTYEGSILDGRNRYRACLETAKRDDITTRVPKYKEYRGIDPEGYVLSENIKRRHMTPSQRAALVVKMNPDGRRTGRPKSGATAEYSSEQLACIAMVGERTVREASLIQRHEPGRLDGIIAGYEEVWPAANDIRRKTKKPKQLTPERKAHDLFVSVNRAGEQFVAKLEELATSDLRKHIAPENAAQLMVVLDAIGNTVRRLQRGTGGMTGSGRDVLTS